MKFIPITFAAALLVAGTTGYAAADNATTTAPAQPQTQAPTGTVVTAPSSTAQAAAPITAPKKSQRARRAERGTKIH